MSKQSGPLASLRVLEFASIGPGPHCAMLLADMGADVVRIARRGGIGSSHPVVDRGRASIEVDIKSEEGRTFCLKAIKDADVLIEGLRPGVMERLGLGPEVALEHNPRLIYGRMTGWGQSGPLAQAAGHDINYIALAGALAAIGRPSAPAVPPLNLVGDFGGGSMFLAFGILAALFERERSGIGQVVDAAMIDGVSSLMTMFSGLPPAAGLSLERERNMLGGAAPFYRSYLCSDGVEIAVGAIEPAFYAELLDKIGAPAEFHSGQNDVRNWPERSRVLEEIFRGRTSQQWQSLLEGTDACFSVVLPFGEAPSHPHMNARDTYVRFEGLLQAAPAPRFSRTPGAIQTARDAAQVLHSWAKSSS
jgi:alpha-methylacyl-CoA racemase